VNESFTKEILDCFEFLGNHKVMYEKYTGWPVDLAIADHFEQTYRRLVQIMGADTADVQSGSEDG